jgi:hypothetical protein
MKKKSHYSKSFEWAAIIMLLINAFVITAMGPR